MTARAESSFIRRIGLESWALLICSERAEPITGRVFVRSLRPSRGSDFCLEPAVVRNEFSLFLRKYLGLKLDSILVSVL